MSRAKRASKRKSLTKVAGVSALGAAGLGLSLMGGASASALPTADVPQAPNTTPPNQRFILGEEEMADVSLATFHLFDRENGTAGLLQLARGGCGGCGGCHGCGGGGGCGGFRGCGGIGVGVGCRGCGCRGCGCGGCGCAGVGVGLGLLGLGLVGGCGWGGGWGGGCGWGGCCASWGVCRFC